MTEKILSPPACIRDMKELDKSKFTKVIKIPVLSVDVSLVHSAINAVKKYLLKLENIKQVHDDSVSKKKVIYLNPDLVKNFHSIEDKWRKLLNEYGITADNLSFIEITTGYENWNAHEIINCIIPESCAFSGFTQTGSIIHVNLRNELLPYKRIIGEILLHKVKNCKSVVNKIQSIENVYRTFNMELLAGDENLQTTANENGCKFEMDFRTVYWNSRLHEEHYEIISKLNKGDVLYDVFSGIGPFAIPASKKGCIVLANDANPESCKYLLRNKQINKVKSGLEIFNKDGADFIRQDVKRDLLKRACTFNAAETYRIHVTMNLPSIAYQFLTPFVGLFSKNESSSYPDQLLPIIHLYCFVAKNSDAKQSAKILVEEALNFCLENVEVFPVRNVSPKKQMMRVSFTLTKQILTSGKRRISSSGDEVNEKKQHLDNEPSSEMNMTY